MRGTMIWRVDLVLLSQCYGGCSCWWIPLAPWASGRNRDSRETIKPSSLLNLFAKRTYSFSSMDMSAFPSPPPPPPHEAQGGPQQQGRSRVLQGNGQPVISQQRWDPKPQRAVSGSPFSSLNVPTWHAGQGLPQDLPAGAQKQNASQPLVMLQKHLIQLLCL